MRKDDDDKRNVEHQKFIDSHRQVSNSPKPPDERPKFETPKSLRQKGKLPFDLGD